MTESFQPNLDFNAEEVEEREAFVVDLEGYEGPLHVLLALARNQKVDLLKLSITQLAEQYLAFVHEARRRNFALAADYLVMASWLAYLKSRLLLPRTDKGKPEEPPAEEMAAALAFRLQKLEAMRKAVEQLMARPQLKRDVFTRGDPEATVIVPSAFIVIEPAAGAGAAPGVSVTLPPAPTVTGLPPSVSLARTEAVVPPAAPLIGVAE